MSDPETKAQISRAEAINAMLQSSGWKFAEDDLMELVAELKDISTIDLEQDTIQQIRDRRNLAESLLEWVAALKSQVNNAIMAEADSDKGLVERR